VIYQGNRLNPSMRSSLCNRGYEINKVIWAARCRYNMAINLDPKLVEALRHRGMVKKKIAT